VSEFSTEQAVDYIKCAKELNVLSSLLMQQATDEKERLKNEISEQSGVTLYWLWRITNDYLDEVKLKKGIDRQHEENKN
jgi:hypothetical protein